MEKKINFILVVLILSIFIWIYIAGTMGDVIDVDSAQYASIGMEMFQNHSYLTVTERGQDYLDKPPFLFWISCVSYKIFGITSFAYKLPTLIFSIICLFFTYKTGSYLYNKNVGKIAAVVLGTSAGFYWINNDVKTDAILTSCVIFSLYYLILFIDKKRLCYIILAGIGIGVGMLTKGPLAFCLPLAVILVPLALQRRYFVLFNLKWLFLPIVVFVILLPMLIGLYHQFDIHPEKTINNKTSVSGIRFFFWEQSFGRITGENQWKNNTTLVYLFHTVLMLIFPYTIILITSYFRRIGQIFRKNHEGEPYLHIWAILVLIAISFSQYKIPQYSVVIFPAIAIIIANELTYIHNLLNIKWLRIHNLIIALLVFSLIIISLVSFNFKWYHAVAIVILFASFVISHISNRSIISLFIIGLAIGFVFNLILIPGFQKYNQGRQLAKLIKKENIKKQEIFFFNRESRAIEFFLQKRITQISWNELLEKMNKKESAWYYMSLDGKESLLNAGLEIDQELYLTHYDMNRLKIGFINPNTREKYLEYRFLIKFKTHNCNN